MSTNTDELFFVFAIEIENDILYGELSFVNGGVERTQQPGNGSGDKRLTGRHRT